MWLVVVQSLLGSVCLKNNSRRITYGIGCVSRMPSLSPLSSLVCYLIMLQSHRQSHFARIRLGGSPHAPWNVYMAKFDPGWEGNPVWQTGLPALAGHSTYHVPWVPALGASISLISPSSQPFPTKIAFAEYFSRLFSNIWLYVTRWVTEAGFELLPTIAVASVEELSDDSSGARFSKVPIINGPGKLSPFTLKIEVSIVLHLMW